MFMQHFADGILTGAIIALSAIGLTLTLGILRFANFSHSELLTWGAYLSLVFIGFFGAASGAGEAFGPFSFGWPMVFALIFSAVGTCLLALMVDYLLFRPLRGKAARLTLVFASFGAALVMRHVVLLIFGPQAEYYTRELQMAVKLAPNVRILPDQIVILVLALVLVVLLHLFLAYTRLGIAMRATAENPVLARISGVDAAAILRWTWIIGATFAAVSGTFYGLTVQLRPELGFNLILPIFAAAILGGAGSVYGAVLGGLIIGLAENLSVLWISPSYKPAIPFLVLLLILYFRPSGLFGAPR